MTQNLAGNKVSAYTRDEMLKRAVRGAWHHDQHIDETIAIQSAAWSDLAAPGCAIHDGVGAQTSWKQLF